MGLQMITVSIWHLIEIGLILVAITAGYYRLSNSVSLLRKDVQHMGRALDGLPCKGSISKGGLACND